MRRGHVVLVVVLIGLGAAMTLGCRQQPRKENPIARINRLRLGYRISANWYEMRTAKDGARELIMNLNARNTSKECLKQVTMLLRVVSGDRTNRLSQPLTLDVSNIPAEGSGQLEPVVRGVEVFSGEDVVLQMEEMPSTKAREVYPEYKEGTSS